MADLEKQLAAAPETVYPAASITKSFGAIAILKLAEQGKLNVEDEVAKYLEYPVTLKGGPVRIKHLLTHTDGIDGDRVRGGAHRQLAGVGECGGTGGGAEGRTGIYAGCGGLGRGRGGGAVVL